MATAAAHALEVRDSLMKAAITPGTIDAYKTVMGGQFYEWASEAFPDILLPLGDGDIPTWDLIKLDEFKENEADIMSSFVAQNGYFEDGSLKSKSSVSKARSALVYFVRTKFDRRPTEVALEKMKRVQKGHARNVTIGKKNKTFKVTIYRFIIDLFYVRLCELN